LERLADGAEAFTLIMDDPLSNSFIQQEDYANLVTEEYERSEELNTELGLNLPAM
jgi:C4-type Zn-finger protein